MALLPEDYVYLIYDNTALPGLSGVDTATSRTKLWDYVGLYNPLYPGTDPDGNPEVEDDRPVDGVADFDAATMGWVVVPGYDHEEVPDREITATLRRVRYTVDPATSVVSRVLEDAPLSERQREVLRHLWNRRKQIVRQIGLHAKTSSLSWSDLRAVLDRIDDVETHPSWGSNPEAILSDALYAEPAVTTDATPVASRLAQLMDRRTIASEKLIPYDSSNLTPLGNLDTPDSSLYNFINLPAPVWTTNTKLGGYAIELGPRTVAGTLGQFQLFEADYVPVEEGETLVFRWNYRSTNLADTWTNGAVLVASFLDENHAFVTATGLPTVSPAPSWQAQEQQIVVPAGCKYAGWMIWIPTGADPLALVRADGISIRKVIGTELLAADAATSMDVATEGSNTAESITATSSMQLGSSVLPDLTVVRKGTPVILNMAIELANNNASGQTRLIIELTKRLSGGSASVILVSREWFDGNLRHTVNFHFVDTTTETGTYLYQFRIYKEATGVGTPVMYRRWGSALSTWR